MKPIIDATTMVVTNKVDALRLKNEQFYDDLEIATDKFLDHDWGITAEESVEANNEALESGDMILAVYETCEGNIWIITDDGHELTTILFPEEY